MNHPPARTGSSFGGPEMISPHSPLVNSKQRREPTVQRHLPIASRARSCESGRVGSRRLAQRACRHHHAALAIGERETLPSAGCRHFGFSVDLDRRVGKLKEGDAAGRAFERLGSEGQHARERSAAGRIPELGLPRLRNG